MKQVRSLLAVLGVTVFLLGIAAVAFTSSPLHADTTAHATTEYVGADTCFTCHYDAYPRWDTRLQPVPTLDVASPMALDVAVLTVPTE